MGKENGSIYRPIDKIAGVSWGFIKLVCGRHKENHPGLVLRDRTTNVRMMTVRSHSRLLCMKDCWMRW